MTVAVGRGPAGMLEAGEGVGSLDICARARVQSINARRALQPMRLRWLLRTRVLRFMMLYGLSHLAVLALGFNESGLSTNQVLWTSPDGRLPSAVRYDAAFCEFSGPVVRDASLFPPIGSFSVLRSRSFAVAVVS